jgi:hypothetical protein
MTSRAVGVLTFAANLAVFSICAGFAFTRNSNALFYHYDGPCLLLDIRDQFYFGQPTFEYVNNFMQSLGNIQFMQNARLLFFFWPIGWFADLGMAEVVSGLLVAATVFISAYAMARLLGQSPAVGAAAGWILGFMACPFVPIYFFNPLLYFNPHLVLIVVAPVTAFWLIEPTGRSSLMGDIARTLGLLAWAVYALAASALLVPIMVVGTIPYVALAFYLVRSRPELWRKLAVLASVLIVAVALQWPWYVLGLFLDSAVNFFHDDFTAMYQNKEFGSILFQEKFYGWAGPLLVGVAALGAVLELKSACRQLRAAAWLLLGLIAVFIVTTVILVAAPHWIWPAPIYFEIAVWPLYAVFAGVLLIRVSNIVVAQLARRQWRLGTRGYPQLIAPIVALVFAAVLVLRKPPTPSSYFPFPQRITPVVAILKANITIDSASVFKGRIMTALPVEAGVVRGVEPWHQQFAAAAYWAATAGNDEMSVGLWSYRIPTLFEYNQLLSPAFHALIKRALQRPPLTHERNAPVLTYPDVHVLQLLGVRYVLMPKTDRPPGELLASEDRRGGTTWGLAGPAAGTWGLFELPAPNLATYSPTSIETRSDLASALDFVVDDSVDLSKRAVAKDQIAGPLTPVQSSALSMAGRDLHLVAESDGRSLLVVPIEFSHCLELHDAHPGIGGEPTISRIDGLLTGIAFERRLDAVLSFRIGPLHNPACRWQDYRDLRVLLPDRAEDR